MSKKFKIFIIFVLVYFVGSHIYSVILMKKFQQHENERVENIIEILKKHKPGKYSKVTLDNFTELVAIDLSNSGFSNNDIEFINNQAISTIIDLKEINLEKTDVDAIGLKKIFTYFPDLQRISISKNSITQEELDRISQSNKTCEIVLKN